MRKPKIDPVLSALIAKLPASGGAWPADQRAAWFEMMWLSCNVVYGGAGDMPIVLKPKPPATPTAPEYARAVLESASRLPAFFIDAMGVARNSLGDPINPKDVNGNVIVDLRGEGGDLGTIKWADGSTGTRGHQLEITTSVS